MNLKLFLSATFVSAAFLASAQEARTYAITGDGNGDYLWRNIRQVDLSAGKLVKDVMTTATKVRTLDGTSKKELSPNLARGGQGELVAASAFDKIHNRLFFATMQTGQLRWIDVNEAGDQLKVYRLQDKLFTASNNVIDEALNITRMCMGADGNGYAVSNDGNHFYRFTTGKKINITDLGNLVDADANNGISVHNKCTSWGGDMVADALGKLYIISASHNVFALDIDSRIATHMGAIKGLPGTYTTNGAAVVDDENIVVSSANTFDGFYKVNFKSLSATKMEGSDKIYNASDLANGNLLYERAAVALHPAKLNLAGDTRIFPNPVTGAEFKVLFDKQDAGKYTIALADLAGRTIQTKVVGIAVSKGSQAESFRLTRKLAKGVYLVKVTNEAGEITFSDKVIIN